MEASDVLDAIFIGSRKFEIALKKCDDSNCTCNDYYDRLYWEKSIKKEYLFEKFLPILYCNVLEKTTKSKTKKDDTLMEILHGDESNHVNFKQFQIKDKQRFLEKTYIRISFGPNAFKYKHRHQKTFTMVEFCSIVQNNELLNKLGFDSMNEECIISLNQQIYDFFFAKKQ